MSLESRSRQGCWTCRLRKKKCDEGRPSCKVCLSLGLECFDYTQKPEWMDGGSQEIAQLVKTKRMVATAVKDRKNRQRKYTGRPKTHVPDELSTLALPQPSSSSGNMHLPESQPLVDASWNGSEEIVSENNFDLNEYFWSSGSISPDDIVNNTELTIHSVDDEIEMFSPPDVSALQTDNNNVSNVDLRFFSSRSTPTDPQDATLLLHYLDHVYEWQFDGNVPTEYKIDKSWILGQIWHSQIVRLAVLSLSTLHLHLLAQQDQPNTAKGYPPDFTTRYNEALMMFRDFLLKGQESNIGFIPTNTQVLVCTMMFLSISELQGAHNDWRSHLKAAVSFIHGQKFEPSPGKDPMLFLSSLLLWLDIISGFSCAQNSDLHDRYMRALVTQSPTVSFEQIVGCQNWTMVVLLKVCELRRWKETNRARGTLVAHETFHRATLLRRELQQGSKAMSVQAPFDVYMVTSTFSSAIAVLLEVVVSGAYPELPAIQVEVESTLKSLSFLANPRLLKVLLWPLCVIGCFAGNFQRVHFQNLLLEHGNGDKQPYAQLLQVLTTSWRAQRETEGQEIQWQKALHDLDVCLQRGYLSE